LRIIHIFHSYYPSIGGIERAMQSIAKELVKFGHEVHVITSRFGAEDRPKEEVMEGVHIHRIKALRLHYPDLTIPIEVPREVLEKADVMLCWAQNSYFTYKVCKYAKKLGKPLAVYFIGVNYLKHHYNPFIRVLSYPYSEWITRKMASLADVAFVTNEYEKKVLKKKFSINAIVLPHGIDDMYLKLPNMAEVFKRKYNINERIISFIGRIHPTKGLDILFRAFIHVTREAPDVILVVAGKGDEKYLNKCLKIAEKAGIKDRIRILGYISEEDKIALIDASDIVVLPTKHAGESYPLLVNEILARGKKFIMTRGSIASKWIEECGIGRIVDVDPQSIARALIEELKSGGNSGKKNDKKTIDIPMWRDIAYKLLKLLGQV
jgi:glycosyltransferase involved in cell wall biosynthesis